MAPCCVDVGSTGAHIGLCISVHLPRRKSRVCSAQHMDCHCGNHRCTRNNHCHFMLWKCASHVAAQFYRVGHLHDCRRLCGRVEYVARPTGSGTYLDSLFHPYRSQPHSRDDFVLRKYPQVLQAVGLTAVVVIGLTIFAVQTKWDFTMMGGILFVSLLLMIVISLIMGFTSFGRSNTGTLILSGFGALLFAVYLICEYRILLASFRPSANAKHSYFSIYRWYSADYGRWT